MTTILLVDDNDDLRRIFTLFLKAKGYSVSAAASGRECLALLTGLRPDLILLDIMMPEMDGWEVLCAIKTSPETRNLPVVMCSGKVPTPEEIEDYGRDIEEYLVKPLELRSLTGTLNRVMELHRSRICTRENLARKFPGLHQFDMFDDHLKKIGLLEKFSRHFCGEREKTEQVIRDHKTMLITIRNTFPPSVTDADLGLHAGGPGTGLLRAALVTPDRGGPPGPMANPAVMTMGGNFPGGEL